MEQFGPTLEDLRSQLTVETQTVLSLIRDTGTSGSIPALALRILGIEQADWNRMSDRSRHTIFVSQLVELEGLSRNTTYSRWIGDQLHIPDVRGGALSQLTGSSPGESALEVLLGLTRVKDRWVSVLEKREWRDLTTEERNWLRAARPTPAAVPPGIAIPTVVHPNDLGVFWRRQVKELVGGSPIARELARLTSDELGEILEAMTAGAHNKVTSMLAGLDVSALEIQALLPVGNARAHIKTYFESLSFEDAALAFEQIAEEEFARFIDPDAGSAAELRVADQSTLFSMMRAWRQKMFGFDFHRQALTQDERAVVDALWGGGLKNSWLSVYQTEYEGNEVLQRAFILPDKLAPGLSTPSELEEWMTSAVLQQGVGKLDDLEVSTLIDEYQYIHSLHVAVQEGRISPALLTTERENSVIPWLWQAYMMRDGFKGDYESVLDATSLDIAIRALSNAMESYGGFATPEEEAAALLLQQNIQNELNTLFGSNPGGELATEEANNARKISDAHSKLIDAYNYGIFGLPVGFNEFAALVLVEANKIVDDTRRLTILDQIHTIWSEYERFFRLPLSDIPNAASWIAEEVTQRLADMELKTQTDQAVTDAGDALERAAAAGLSPLGRVLFGLGVPLMTSGGFGAESFARDMLTPSDGETAESYFARIGETLKAQTELYRADIAQRRLAGEDVRFRDEFAILTDRFDPARFLNNLGVVPGSITHAAQFGVTVGELPGINKAQNRFADVLAQKQEAQMAVAALESGPEAHALVEEAALKFISGLPVNQRDKTLTNILLAAPELLAQQKQKQEEFDAMMAAFEEKLPTILAQQFGVSVEEINARLSARTNVPALPGLEDKPEIDPSRFTFTASELAEIDILAEQFFQEMMVDVETEPADVVFEFAPPDVSLLAPDAQEAALEAARREQLEAFTAAQQTAESRARAESLGWRRRRAETQIATRQFGAIHTAARGLRGAAPPLQRGFDFTSFVETPTTPEAPATLRPELFTIRR